MKPLSVEIRMTVNNYWVVVGVKNKNATDIYIPDRVDGFEVRSIAERAFANNQNIVYVNMPSTINYIGEDAFRNCKNLERVYRYHSQGKMTVKSRAFADCSKLVSVYLNGIHEFGSEVFKNCTSLQEFPFKENPNIPNFLRGTFENTKIKTITLVSQQICRNAFSGTPVEEIFIIGKPRFSDEFIEIMKNAKVYVRKNSPMMDLAFHGIYVEEMV